MSVAGRARMLAKACRAAMPDAHVYVAHSRNYWGNSSYVTVCYQRPGVSIVEKARISDHHVGLRRYIEDWTSLYLSPKARSEDWVLWLGALVKRYTEAGGAPLVQGHGPLFGAAEGARP